MIIVGSRADKGRHKPILVKQLAIRLSNWLRRSEYQVQQFAHQLASMTDHIDILLNSIGVLPERHLSADGYDLNLVLNYHLDHSSLVTVAKAQ